MVFLELLIIALLWWIAHVGRKDAEASKQPKSAEQQRIDREREWIGRTL